MRDEAEKRIGHLYPKVEDHRRDGQGPPRPEGLRRQELTVIAWLWARTVASPNPACRARACPARALVLAFDKEGQEAWVEPVVDRGQTIATVVDVESRPTENAIRGKAHSRPERSDVAF